MAWPLIVAGVGIGLKLLGGLKSASAAKEAGKAEGERQDFNAAIADAQAEDALQRGVEAASRQRAVTRGVIGTQRAAFAGGNVDVTKGSALDVQADAALLGELDAQTITQNAEREAWGYRVTAEDRRMAGNVARKGGAAQASAIRTGAIADTISTGASLLAEKYGW